MTIKSQALAAALLSFPLNIVASLIGCTALTAQGFGGDGDTHGECPEKVAAIGGTFEPDIIPACGIPANLTRFAEVHREAHESCPSSLTIRIGSLRLN